MSRSRAVPSRHGVHLPQDSRVLKSSSTRTASATRTPPWSAAMPPVPGFRLPPGISGSSSRRGWTRMPDGPPTATAASGRASGLPPPLRSRGARRARRGPAPPGPPRGARGAEDLRAGAPAEPDPPVGAPADDERDREEGLDVVDDGGPAPPPRLGRERRLGPRHRAAPLERFHERGLLA